MNGMREMNGTDGIAADDGGGLVRCCDCEKLYCED